MKCSELHTFSPSMGKSFWKRKFQHPPLKVFIFQNKSANCAAQSLCNLLWIPPHPLQRLSQSRVTTRWFVNPFRLSEQQKENSGNKLYKNMRTIGKKSLSYRFVSCCNICGMWFSLLLMLNIARMSKVIILFLTQVLICLFTLSR